MVISNNKILVKRLGKEIIAGIINKTYIRLTRDESKHTMWKHKAWCINKELYNYAISNNLGILIVSSHKSGELANYYIKPDELKKIIDKYECDFDFKGEMQYVIPKTFFYYKRQNEAIYSNPTYITNLHTKRFSIDGNETDSGNSIFIE